MKRLRKPAALLLALVMALTLAACGGKGASKTNPAVGKYIGETVLSFDEWVPMDEVYDLGDNYIELKEDVYKRQGWDLISVYAPGHHHRSGWEDR